jgi:hypothetical protein
MPDPGPRSAPCSSSLPTPFIHAAVVSFSMLATSLRIARPRVALRHGLAAMTVKSVVGVPRRGMAIPAQRVRPQLPSFLTFDKR